jgi:DnaJ-class molecular chaperone
MTIPPYRIRDICPACEGAGTFQSSNGTGGPCSVAICETCAGHGRLSAVMAEKLNQQRRAAAMAWLAGREALSTAKD